MRLTREQRTRLFDGDYRPLVFEKKPCEQGFRYVLSWTRPTPVHDGEGRRFQPPKEPLLTLVVRRVIRGQGRWVVWFDVEDRREPLRLLRSSPPAYDATLMKADQIHPPTEEEIRKAAEESAYTSNPESAFDKLKAVGDGTLKRYVKENNQKDAQRRKGNAQADVEALRQQIAHLRQWSRERGLDARSELRVLERRLEEKLRKRAA